MSTGYGTPVISVLEGGRGGGRSRIPEKGRRWKKILERKEKEEMKIMKRFTELGVVSMWYEKVITKNIEREGKGAMEKEEVEK